jgi:diacylglycerol kinase (ATP)
MTTTIDRFWQRGLEPASRGHATLTGPERLPSGLQPETIEEINDGHRPLRSHSANGQGQCAWRSLERANTPREKPPRLLIIHNHQASRKRADRFRTVLARLQADGCSFEVKQTHAAGDAARFAAEADPATVDLIAVAGGDGTINDAINGFRPDSPPLGLIPLGTANVLAHEIGLGTSPDAIAAALRGTEHLSVVPGVVNGHRFMMMASVGFDAHVVGGVRKSVKRRIGKAAYMFEACRQLALYPCSHLDIRIDGEPVTAATLVISRGRLYGGRFLMAPEADLGEPKLVVTAFRRKGRLAMAGYTAALVLGLLNRWQLIDHIPARSIEVLGRHSDPVQGDGDVICALPATIGLADHPIRLAIPPRCPPHRKDSPTEIACSHRSWGA